jgi:hypothetical protein
MIRIDRKPKQVTKQVLRKIRVALLQWMPPNGIMINVINLVNGILTI